jgi:hypothetical protein
LVGDYYDFGGEPSVAADWILTASPSIFTAKRLNTFTAGSPSTITLNDLSGINTSGYTGIRLTLDSGTPSAAFENNIIIASSENTTYLGVQLDVTYWIYPANSSLTLVDVLPDADTTTTG